MPPDKSIFVRTVTAYYLQGEAGDQALVDVAP